MANSAVAGSRIVVENMLQKETIRLKKKAHVITQVANKMYQGELRQQGDTVIVQQVPKMFGNVGGVAGDSIAESGWAIADFPLQVTEVYQQRRRVKDIEEIQSNLDLRGKISTEIAYGSANHEDQYTASFFTQADELNKVNDKAPITLTDTNTYSNVTELTRVLEEQNAQGTFMLFVTPAIKRQMKLENILDATDMGLGMRLNGQVGTMDGHKVMVTNNLTHVRTLTLDTQPTAGDTIVLDAAIEDATTATGGYTQTAVTFTFVANGTAAAAGEISIGATLADTQASVVEAINGTGTQGASNYIDVAAASRTGLKNNFVKAGDFDAADKSTVQSAVRMPNAPTTSLTGGANGISADAVLMTAVDSNSINTVFQEDQFKITDDVTAFAENLLQEKVYGGAVLGDNAKGIATNEILTGLA